jgi:hypothetical protein
VPSTDLESGGHRATRIVARADFGSLEWDTSIAEEAHRASA